MGEHYTCEACGETFDYDWSDEEAWAEAKALWTPEELEHTSVICDDCFQRVMSRGGAQGVRDRHRIEALVRGFAGTETVTG